MQSNLCTHAVIWARDDHTGANRQLEPAEREPRCNHQPSSECFPFIQLPLQNHEDPAFSVAYKSLATACLHPSHTSTIDAGQCTLPRSYFSLLSVSPSLLLQSKALEAARAALEAKRQQSPAEPRSGYFQYSSGRQAQPSPEASAAGCACFHGACV